jgi:acyl-coenzyme A thioesterase PaaI-like protein
MAAAPISRKDFWHFGGVSRTLSVTYLRPIQKGITIIVKCKVIQIGKNHCIWTQPLTLPIMAANGQYQSDYPHESVPKI